MTHPIRVNLLTLHIMDPESVEYVLPYKATPLSTGYDLRSNIDTTIRAGQYLTIPTGLMISFTGMERGKADITVRPRSGLAAKHGITVLNSPGTIDMDYEGEIKVILINHGQEDFEIKRGDRIAQLIVGPILVGVEVGIPDRTPSERGSGGFGSTGIK